MKKIVITEALKNKLLQALSESALKGAVALAFDLNASPELKEAEKKGSTDQGDEGRKKVLSVTS